MDTMLPKMEGLEATRAIHDIAQFRSLPIVWLTAKTANGDREKALLSGRTEYATKRGLLAVLRTWMGRKPPASRRGIAGPRP